MPAAKNFLWINSEKSRKGGRKEREPGRKTGMENRDGKDYTIPIMLAAAPERSFRADGAEKPKVRRSTHDPLRCRGHRWIAEAFIEGAPLRAGCVSRPFIPAGRKPGALSPKNTGTSRSGPTWRRWPRQRRSTPFTSPAPMSCTTRKAACFWSTASMCFVKSRSP